MQSVKGIKTSLSKKSVFDNFRNGDWLSYSKPDGPLARRRGAMAHPVHINPPLSVSLIGGVRTSTGNEKALRETQKLLAGCSKAGPKIFALPQTPFPRAQDGQNLTSWRWSLPSPTDPVWWRSMHAISSYHSYRGSRPTNKQTHKHTCKQSGPITIHCAAKLSVRCNKCHTGHTSNT